MQELDRAWHVTYRRQAYEGEVIAALLRVSLVVVFYSVQLVHYLGFAEVTEVSRLLHRYFSMLCAGWLLLSLAVLVVLRQRFFPEQLKYVVCALDLCLLTAAASLGAGPTSPLVMIYFLIIMLSGLRVSVPLVWVATLGSLAGYLVLVGRADSSWFDAEHATPVVNQLVTLVSMAAAGVITGQVVRQFRRAAMQTIESRERLQHFQTPSSEQAGGSE